MCLARLYACHSFNESHATPTMPRSPITPRVRLSSLATASQTIAGSPDGSDATAVPSSVPRTRSAAPVSAGCRCRTSSRVTSSRWPLAAAGNSAHTRPTSRSALKRPSDAFVLARLHHSIGPQPKARAVLHSSTANPRGALAAPWPPAHTVRTRTAAIRCSLLGARLFLLSRQRLRVRSLLARPGSRRRSPLQPTRAAPLADANEARSAQPAGCPRAECRTALRNAMQCRLLWSDGTQTGTAVRRRRKLHSAHLLAHGLGVLRPTCHRDPPSPPPYPCPRTHACDASARMSRPSRRKAVPVVAARSFAWAHAEKGPVALDGTCLFVSGASPSMVSTTSSTSAPSSSHACSQPRHLPLGVSPRRMLQPKLGGATYGLSTSPDFAASSRRWLASSLGHRRISRRARKSRSLNGWTRRLWRSSRA